MCVDMGPGGNILAGIADDLRIFAHRLSGGDVTCRQLVVSRDDRLRRDRLDGKTGFERLCRCDNIVASGSRRIVRDMATDFHG